jgi:hypothetical protein
LVGLHETMGNEGSKILAERFDAFLLDNAHASEVATLTLGEQQLSLDTTLDEAMGKVPEICGVLRRH